MMMRYDKIWLPGGNLLKHVIPFSRSVAGDRIALPVWPTVERRWRGRGEPEELEREVVRELSMVEVLNVIRGELYLDDEIHQRVP
jgi:hypothetical protein